MSVEETEEYKRLDYPWKETMHPWNFWGPYVSDRSWGTVREDYSEDGDVWHFFSREYAPSRAYRWGEDGIAGFCDRYQTLVLAPALWNGKDPILKERLFGLVSDEGNHGEDVKESYYYLDATPTHSYMKFLYKYPQNAFPYQEIIDENKKRSPKELEYELVDTGIFDQDEYFDVFIEYAKAEPHDICVKVEICNRSDRSAPIDFLMQLWFRNQWGWKEELLSQPEIRLKKDQRLCLEADDENLRYSPLLPLEYEIEKRLLYGSEDGEALFTNNETNKEKIWDTPNSTPYVKDAFHEKIINNKDCVDPSFRGSKAALHYHRDVKPKSSEVLYFRFTDNAVENPLKGVENIVQKRKKEADEYYEAIQPKAASEDEKLIQRQAFAGMIWSKQIYLYDVSTWLQGDDRENPPPKERTEIRNNHWRHLSSMRIFSMPDKWEYPWFAAWDLAFQCVVFSLVDLGFAKHQLWTLLLDQFQHPNGQVPAYEWEFSDVNPPVQAWAALKLFNLEKERFNREDYDFLELCFHKLLLNFSWWINKIDHEGHNVFEGGFLGLDNISLIDRSKPFPNGGKLDQTDGSGWMAMFCLNLMRMALILSNRNENYYSMATKFFEHFVYIAASVRKGYWRGYDMWDDHDGFFYSVARYPDGKKDQFRVRSLVGVIPFFATDVFTDEELAKHKGFYNNFSWFMKNRAHLTDRCINVVEKEGKKTYVFSMLHEKEALKFLENIWDPKEFRSDYGLRSISKFHEKHPFSYHDHTLQYEPGESLVKIKGGNSNWRGPIWFPTTYLLIDVLRNLSNVYGKEFQIEVSEEDPVDICTMAQSFGERLIQIFAEDDEKKRAVYQLWPKYQDPHFRNYLMFFEHYHGDSGRGLGASHQTGWSGLIANIIDECRRT